MGIPFSLFFVGLVHRGGPRLTPLGHLGPAAHATGQGMRFIRFSTSRVPSRLTASLQAGCFFSEVRPAQYSKPSPVFGCSANVLQTALLMFPAFVRSSFGLSSHHMMLLMSTIASKFAFPASYRTTYTACDSWSLEFSHSRRVRPWCVVSNHLVLCGTAPPTSSLTARLQHTSLPRGRRSSPDLRCLQDTAALV